MEMSALGLNQLAHGQVVFALPLARDDGIAGDLLKTPQQMGEGMRRRILESQHFYVEIIETKVIRVARQSRITQLKINKIVIFQAHAVDLVRRVVEQLSQEPKGPLLVERLHVKGILQLDDEAHDLIGENLARPVEFALQDGDTRPA